MLKDRCPVLAQRLLEQLEGTSQATASVTSANKARRTLLREGYEECPSWTDVWEGRRPENTSRSEPGEWRHGWQFYAAAQRDKHYRKRALLPVLDSGSAALLCSQAGRASAAHLCALPVDKARTLHAHHLRVLLLRRLRLELPLSHKRCKCGRKVDLLGDHYASCATVGKLALRAIPLKRMWARVCCEAGARVL